MRKVDNSTSQDGADTTSITSTIESEGKKSSTGLKTKRNSIKRKMPNFSHDSDDTAIEPLLQSEKEKSDKNRSAKFSMSKSKSDLINETPNIVTESHLDHITKTSSCRLSENIPSINTVKDISVVNTSATAPIYNHMNTNIFVGLDTAKPVQTKSAVIVEIDNTKSSYSPSPMIFTTAKIHANNQTKPLEPLQITPVPILSTIEGNIIKSKPSTSGDAGKKYDYTNSKIDTQKIRDQENNDKFTKASNFIDKSITTSMTITTDSKSKPSNISKENTYNIKILSPVQVTSNASFDKSLKATDVNINTDKTNSKVDLSHSTVAKSDKTLQHHEKPRGLAGDNSSVNKTEKVVSDSAQFDPPKTIGNLSNVEKVLPIDGGKKQTSEDISFHKPVLKPNKESFETTKTHKDGVNKEKPSKLVTNVSSSRQLQRQKNATIEEINDEDIKNKNIDCSKSESKNLIKDQNITINMPTKDSIQKEADIKVKSVVDRPKIPTEKEVTTKLVKPNNTPSASRTDKTSLVSEVPIKQPKTLVTSAKSSASETKSISSNDTKPNIVTAGSGMSKPKSTTSDKEVVLEPKTVPQTTAVSSSSDNIGSLQNVKSSSAIKTGPSSTIKPKLSNNTTLPSTVTKTASQSLGTKTPSTTGSTTTILKDASSSVPSSTSAKSTITGNKKIEPILSKHNKDSRA